MACPVCTPELDPIGERRHEEHYGIRFEDWNVLVFKASEMLPDCYEVDVREGRAWRYVWPTRFCECGNGAAAYIDTGRFEVRPSEALGECAPEGSVEPASPAESDGT